MKFSPELESKRTIILVVKVIIFIHHHHMFIIFKSNDKTLRTLIPLTGYSSPT